MDANYNYTVQVLKQNSCLNKQTVKANLLKFFAVLLRHYVFFDSMKVVLSILTMFQYKNASSRQYSIRMHFTAVINFSILYWRLPFRTAEYCHFNYGNCSKLLTL